MIDLIRIALILIVSGLLAVSPGLATRRPAPSGEPLSVVCSSPTVLCVSSDENDAEREFSSPASAATVAGPGDTVYVKPGRYRGFRVTTSGRRGSPVLFLASNKTVVIDRDGPTGDGVRLQNVSYVTIAGFSITGVSGRCIAARGASEVSPMVGNAVIDNECRESGLGGFYLSQFSGGLVEGNRVLDVTGDCSNGRPCRRAYGVYLANAGSDGTILRRNVITGPDGPGIHFNGDQRFGGDGVISDLIIEGNIISGSPDNALNMDGVQNSVIRNNLFYDNGRNGIRGFRIDAAAGPRGLVIVNNTILASAGSGWAIKLTDDRGGHVMFNNILLGKSVAVGGGLFASDHNIVSGWFSLDGDQSQLSLTQWRNAGYGASSIIGVPESLLQVTDSGYLVPGNATSIDAGIWSYRGIEAPPADIAGILRPQGAQVDIGAYER